MSVLVTGDGEIVDPDRPMLFADDLAALRGDGVFETLLVRAGRARLIDAHLDRLTAGAAALALPAPDAAALRRAIDVAGGEWTTRSGVPRSVVPEGVLRISYSRGRESRPEAGPTCYLTVGPVADRVALARRDGIAVLTLERGWTAQAHDAPWLLAGIKALAYAGNIAALRYAADRGADDAIFVGPDGAVWEGPRSTVVIARGSELVTPPRSGPILPGTTQAALFAQAAAQGMSAVEAPLTVDDLRRADGVWLLSSITLAARVRTLDGTALRAPAPEHLEVATLVDAAVAADETGQFA